jgi:hypothetical protein
MNDRLASHLRWLVVAVYFVLTSLGHLRFTQWLLQPRQSEWLGAYAFKDAVPALLVTAGVALLAWIVRTAWRDPRGVWATGGYWVLWAACVTVVDRLLTYSVYEYAHYPQYALLAWLIARALDPQRTGQAGGRILFWATLLGMVDECMQYLWITPSYGHYLDFNDFLVNLLAASAGVMLHAGACRPCAPAARALRPWTEWLTVLGLATVLAGAMAAGRLQVSPPVGLAVPAGGFAVTADGVTRLYLQRAPDWYGSVQAGPHRGAYRVLSPGFSVVVMLLVGWVFARDPAWYRSGSGRRAWRLRDCGPGRESS